MNRVFLNFRRFRAVLPALTAALALGLFLAAAPAPAQNGAEDSWAALKPKLTGLGKALWDFAGATPYLDEIPRAESVEAAGDYGYYLDEPNGFLYSASWDGPCGCGERFRAAAFKKSGGDYLLVKSGIVDTCYNMPVAEATEPWDRILPPGFSLQNFYRSGEKMPADRGLFLIQVDIPEKGLDLTLTARPLMNVVSLKYDPEKIFSPITHSDWYETSEVRFATYALSLRDDVAKAVREGLLDERFTGRTDFSPEDLRALAAVVARGKTPEAEWIESAGEALAGHYEIYREYLKLGVKSFILSWSRADGRFRIKDKVPLDPPPSFLDFLLSDGWLFKPGC